MNCWLPIRAHAPDPPTASARASPPSYAEASRGSSRMSRLTFRAGRAAWWTSFIVAGLAWVLASSHPGAQGADVSAGLRVDVVATGIARPIQLALDSQGRLVVLSHGWRGDAAAEILRIDLGGHLPVDAARMPRVVVPFADESRKTVFGGLALDPQRGDLFLGEENGNRIYRQGIKAPWSSASILARSGRFPDAPMCSSRSCPAAEQPLRTRNPCGGSSAWRWRPTTTSSS